MGYIKGSMINEAEEYLRAHPEVAERNLAIYNESERLISEYSSVLTDKEFCQARLCYWGCTSIEQYWNKFLNVLISSYNVWDESHRRYTRLLEAVRDLNPEWTSKFKAAYVQKLKAVKVPVYPIS